MAAKKKNSQAGETAIQLRFDSSVAPVDFIKIEKNLSSLGFFTPTNIRVRGTAQKTVSFIREVDGKRVETRATILPSAKYGLPITADQDKYLALQKIICEKRAREGQVTNPIGFTSAELLRILGKEVRSGKNYDDVTEWMKRMTLTGINSQGVVYLAGRKRWADKTFHVFESAVSVGQEMADGRIADMNYIWLSEWQLENINNNYVLPIDLETYRKLKNHIAKALVPLLQIWLYASRADGRFEKRYTELCQILNIRRWEHLSKIKQVLSPSLDELVKHEYLSDWAVEPTIDEKDYKVSFRHGGKFHRDQRNRLGQRDAVPGQKMIGEGDAVLRQELVRRGISEDRARQLLASIPDSQPVLDQIEWGDHILAGAPRDKFYNPPGFYIYLLTENMLPPQDFEGSRKRLIREAAKQAREAERRREIEVNLAYEEYCRREVDLYIREQQGTPGYRKLYESSQKDLLKQNRSYALLPPGTLRELIEGAIRRELASQVEVMSIEEFATRNPQERLF